MGLFRRLKIGFGMARRSIRVLMAYPRLLVFPLLGGLAGIAFIATLFGGVFAAGTLFQEQSTAVYVILFAAYLVETFIASFFTAALVVAAGAVFRGEQPSIRGSLAVAWRRKLPLLIWSVVAAIIGVVIRAIEDQDNLMAEAFATMFAVAWGVMTYFIVPVIVFRDQSFIKSFRDSSRTFKDNWGESLGAMGAVDAITFVLVVIGIALGGVTFIATSGLGVAGILAAVIVGGTGVMAGMLIGKALSGIAKTALYVYATEGTVPSHFDDMDLASLAG